MQGSRVLMALVGLSVTALIGCEASIDSMTVYALDGEFTPGISKPRPGETFHDYPVLGKTEVSSPDDRRAILAAIKKGIAEANANVQVACFWPHHGVSLVRSGRRIEYLICFHCRQVEISGDGEFKHVNTTDAAAGLLDAQLEAAGIPQRK
jgi:hypothetical protein